MKRLIYTIALLGLFAQCTPSIVDDDTPTAATPSISDQTGYETFEMKDGDTTYLMKKYYLCLLKKGPNRSQPEEEANKIQAAHLANMGQLAKDGKLCIAGPADDESDLQGIYILNAKSLQEADSLANTDPAVQAGRLVIELHPWWGAVGTTLY